MESFREFLSKNSFKKLDVENDLAWVSIFSGFENGKRVHENENKQGIRFWLEKIDIFNLIILLSLEFSIYRRVCMCDSHGFHTIGITTLTYV